MKKTKIELPKLPYGEGTMTWDTKNPDLILYRKQHTFKNGKSQRVSVTGFTPRECISRMKEKISEMEYLMEMKKKEPDVEKGTTLSKGMETWLFTKKDKVKDKTFDRYEQTFTSQIKNHEIANLEVAAIVADDIDKYVSSLMNKDLSYSSIKKAFELLRQYMNYVYEKNISSNPMNGITLPKKKANTVDLTSDISDEDLENLADNGFKPITIKDILTDEEIKIFKKEACKEQKVGISGYRYGKILYFMILTFPRIGEMLAVRWKDIDFANKKMRIDKAIATVKNRDKNSEKKTKRIITTAKNDKVRDVMLTDDAIEILQEYKKYINPKSDDDFVCTTIHGTVASDRVLYDSLKLIMKRAGLKKEKFSPHNLRHTGISYYIRHGVPIEMIANMAGHNVSVTQKIYYHIIEEQKNKALDIMNSIKI